MKKLQYLFLFLSLILLSVISNTIHAKISNDIVIPVGDSQLLPSLDVSGRTHYIIQGTLTINGDVNVTGNGQITVDGGELIIYGNLKAAGNGVVLVDGGDLYVDRIIKPGNGEVTTINGGEIHHTSDLPVELISYNIEVDKNKNVDIYWETAQEINNSHFIIEKSYDRKNYVFVDSVGGHGNTNSNVYYESSDRLENNKTTYYRLTQFDFDGKSEAWIQSVAGTNNDISFNIYPNPTSEYLRVQTTINDKELMEFYLVNASNGSRHKLNNTSISYATQTFDLTHLANGIYIIEITKGNQVIYQDKIIKI
ncbi:T9SS type A sorting domain-containing protein [Flammeovirga kamogawensis]|uniref:T9SS type A sorting domain-containing protein n=1 Tax=Flammeovirga kamogawensis TaxID=373891 RepID=A0ABX8GYN5_9BACT|nr:T9SS type A sorting domain-containing protein [Flammeovirga kamogawensis]MBB6459158.1 hypothetical protein [Flammeovirga kamogawensis]QWG08724.1 T9SS type A sorting domain-containing protein [Flammeovirga kamogawensis]TRX67017.1 T9SS type A sorting domain-containing protein [Flammeovirga kamogawensis]